MYKKTIASIALAAAVITGLSVTPAQANNNQYLNQMAMQMYLQNQSAGYNPYYSTGYNPYGAYGNVYNGQTPWSAGAAPYAVGAGSAFSYGSPYGRGYGSFYAPRVYHAYHHHHRWLY
jgi:hypothetical protein